jgi:nicotinate-nucleotide adenylyltransferase
MRLGIFGGTFDPVHLGHLLLAECCREQCRLDEVWFLPAAVPPHKQQRELTPADQRIEMLELAIAGNPAFSVSRSETDRGGVNYTVDTLEHFHQCVKGDSPIFVDVKIGTVPVEEPARELFFLLGADMLQDLPHWRNPARVCELAVPIVVRRPGCSEVDFGCLNGLASAERIDLFRRHQVDMPAMGISSTDIRRRASLGQSLRYLLPRAVEMYIETHGLYRMVK